MPPSFLSSFFLSSYSRHLTPCRPTLRCPRSCSPTPSPLLIVLLLVVVQHCRRIPCRPLPCCPPCRHILSSSDSISSYSSKSYFLLSFTFTSHCPTSWCLTLIVFVLVVPLHVVQCCRTGPQTARLRLRPTKPVPSPFKMDWFPPTGFVVHGLEYAYSCQLIAKKNKNSTPALSPESKGGRGVELNLAHVTHCEKNVWKFWCRYRMWQIND